jgi:hypothetical protein
MAAIAFSGARSVIRAIPTSCAIFWSSVSYDLADGLELIDALNPFLIGIFALPILIENIPDLCGDISHNFFSRKSFCCARL